MCAAAFDADPGVESVAVGFGLHHVSALIVGIEVGGTIGAGCWMGAEEPPIGAGATTGFRLRGTVVSETA